MSTLLRTGYVFSRKQPKRLREKQGTQNKHTYKQTNVCTKLKCKTKQGLLLVGCFIILIGASDILTEAFEQHIFKNHPACYVFYLTKPFTITGGDCNGCCSFRAETLQTLPKIL